MKNAITKSSEGIKIEGHVGKWHVIDDTYHKGVPVYLLEHSTWGDEAASVIVRSDGSIILDDVWNGWDDLDEYASEEGPGRNVRTFDISLPGDWGNDAA